MKKAFGKHTQFLPRLAVFLLALLFLPVLTLAAPDQPTVELTHSGEGDRVVLECTAKMDAPDAEGRVDMTLTLQADKALKLDPDSVQAIYQTEDGETKNLDPEYWETDADSGVLTLSMVVDTDMGGQLLCRVSASGAESRSALTNTAQADVTYYDLETDEVTALSASGKDTIQPPAKPAGYSLTLDLAGGSLSGKGSSFVWQEDMAAGQLVNLGDLPKPARDGYFFDGWTLGSGAGAKVDGGVLTVGSGDVTLQAVWTSMADKLTLDRNGGSGREITLDGTTGEDVVLPDPADVLYSKAGYKLGGWSTTPDGTDGTIYHGGDTYTLTREDDVLYAWWAPQYTLTYDANGGEGQMPRRVFSASEEAVISDNAFTRKGYDFAGWCLSADGRGKIYQSGDTITLTEDATLYAQWEKPYAAPPEGDGNHLALILGILGAVVAAGCIFGIIYLVRRRNEEEPYDGGPYDDGPYDDGYDPEEDRFATRERYDDRFDRRGDRYDDRYDRRDDRYDDRRYDGRDHDSRRSRDRRRYDDDYRDR